MGRANCGEGFVTAYSHGFGLSYWIFRFANIVGPKAVHGVIPDCVAAYHNASPTGTRRSRRRIDWSAGQVGKVYGRDWMGLTAELDDRRRITIPEKLRKKLQIPAGDEFRIEEQEGVLLLRWETDRTYKVRGGRKWGDEAFLEAGRRLSVSDRIVLDVSALAIYTVEDHPPSPIHRERGRTRTGRKATDHNL